MNGFSFNSIQIPNSETDSNSKADFINEINEKTFQSKFLQVVFLHGSFEKAFNKT